MSFTVTPAGEIEFDLAGQHVKLRPSYDRLADIEKRTGRTLLTLLRRAHVLQDLGLRDACLIIHATAVVPIDATETALGDLILEHGLTEVIPVICEVLMIGVGGRSGKNREAPPAGATETAPATTSETSTDSH